MEGLWKRLIAKEDAALAECVSLSRVRISKSSSEMLIQLNASRFLTRREYKRVSRALSGAFPTAKVTVALKYPALREAVESDIKIAKGLLSELVSHQSPASMAFLEWDSPEWTLKNGRLTVCVPSVEGAQILKSRGVDRLLEALMLQLFGIPCEAYIQVTGDEDKKIIEIERQREREMALLIETTSQQTNGNRREKKQSDAIIGKNISDPPLPMDELTEDAGRVTVMGEVAAFDMRDAKNGQTKIVAFSMTDHTGSVNCKIFLTGRRGGDDAQSVQQQADALSAALKDGRWIKARGSYRYDDYKREMTLMVNDIVPVEKPERADAAPEKRVELHCHTQMSAMDACVSATDVIKRAAQWGHKAIAITDHGVVQAFPEAFAAAKQYGVKLLPGCEGYIIEDAPKIVDNPGRRALSECAFVVLDVETTGLNTAKDDIIEIGAVRIENGAEVAEYSQLINPGRALPERITEITGITPAMLADKPSLSEIAPGFAEFIKGSVLVAHNAAFDSAFIKRMLSGIGVKFDFPLLDTLALARNLYPNAKNHKLATLCKMLDIGLKNAHRAVHDARATAMMLIKSLETLSLRRPLNALADINATFGTDAGSEASHIILLVKNQTGMTNLNRLVSAGHLNYFHRTPRMPRALIQKYREGLLLGSACESGELYRALVAGESESAIEKIASFYDFLEIQSVGNNEFLVDDGLLPSEDAIRDINRRIVSLGDKLGKPVVATGDVHFLEPSDAKFRAILMDSKGFDNADRQPPLYYKTTDEMLAEFAYLGAETAKRVVITTPNEIADMVGDVQLFPKHPENKETFQPFWPEAEGELRALVETKTREIYGDKPHEIVKQRIEKELGAIIGYGFSTLYIIAVRLVQKSLADGYIVGSRGSVGSSLVAFLAGITEVNSLPPHYICPKCKRCEFDVPPQHTCGYDLPAKTCPECGAEMDRDGFNIPFEVFLGFEGDKVPDIDLNFSGEYQSAAHNYVRELFGKENVFRAGTIGTIAEKTAYGYVIKYAEARGKSFSNAEKDRLARGITGVKRTTGQHPAGMVVLPKDYEIYQFTAIQRPADDQSADTVTTHLDFGSMHDILVKIDVLGHDDPTMLRRLQEMTGVAPYDVPLKDPEIFSEILTLFTSPTALGLTAEQLGSETGTLGVPEFGTPFVRGMLMQTRPSTMEELLRISGLSHGTAVWLGNTQDLVRAGVPLRECICTRDDIMNSLLALGVKPLMAFKIMEDVRKGKGLKPEYEEAINAVAAPDWYIDSCKKIQYMFPKSHAVAYVTMALRIAYFKIHYPLPYYCCYLMRNADSFDGVTMVSNNIARLRAMIDDLNELDKDERSRKDGEIAVMEILVEMALRGVKIKPVELYRSHAVDFLPDDGVILPPLSSLPGISPAAAETIVAARALGKFISRQDMLSRKIARSTIEQLSLAGLLSEIPETSQVTFFDL